MHLAIQILIVSTSIFCQILNTAAHTFPQPVRRYSTDAVLHEELNYASRRIRYTQTNPDSWKNLYQFYAAKGWAKAEVLCFHGFGGWLLYPKPNWTIGNPSYIRLVVVNHPDENDPLCLVPDDIESLQPIGDTRYRKYASYAFETNYFHSEPKLVNSVDGIKNAIIKSFITTGDQVKWKIQEGEKKACITPDAHPSVICLIPHLDGTLGWTKGTGESTPKRDFTPTATCDGVPERYQLEPQACYVTGIHKIFINQVMTASTMAEMCNETPKNDARINATEKWFNTILEVWGARQEGRLNSMLYRKAKGIKQKLSLVSRVVGVFEHICPTDLVPRQYIHILRKVFEMHVALAHHTDEQLGNINFPEWEPVTKSLRECGEHILALKAEHANRPQHESWAPMLIKKENYCEDRSNESEVLIEKMQTAYSIMDQGKNYDPVFEQIWLILNAASSTCANKYDRHTTNFWVDLVELFRRYYLVPLQQQWYNPGRWLRLYPILFAGFDMDVMRRNIVHCVHRSLQPNPTNETDNARNYAPENPPISRVQMFQRYEERNQGAHPNADQEQATLSPHLQQRSGKIMETENEDNQWSQWS